MPRGDKSAYTSKQKRMAEHIEEGYEDRGVGRDEAERRAWATVNKETGGGKKSGSGRGKKTNTSSSRKGGRIGGRGGHAQASGSRVVAQAVVGLFLTEARVEPDGAEELGQTAARDEALAEPVAEAGVALSEGGVPRGMPPSLRSGRLVRESLSTPPPAAICHVSRCPTTSCQVTRDSVHTPDHPRFTAWMGRFVP